MSETFRFVTPVGRLVGGSLFEMNTKDNEGRPLDPKKHNWWVGLAFPKTAQYWSQETGEIGAVFQAVLSAANAHYKNGEPQNPGFSWKIQDGDDPKHQGKTGYAGHWVVGFSRNVAIDAPPVFDAQCRPIIDKNIAKKGYYYRISGSTSANGLKGDNAGVYINLDMCQLCYGKGEDEIISGPSAQSVFGVFGGAPAGSTAPVTPAAPQFSAPAPAPQPAVVPVTPAAPQFSAPAPAPVAPAPTPAPPAAPVMTAKAGGATYQAFIDGGWTEENMIKEGYMEPRPVNSFVQGNGY